MGRRVRGGDARCARCPPPPASTRPPRSTGGAGGTGAGGRDRGSRVRLGAVWAGWDVQEGVGDCRVNRGRRANRCRRATRPPNSRTAHFTYHPLSTPLLRWLDPSCLHYIIRFVSAHLAYAWKMRTSFQLALPPSRSFQGLVLQAALSSIYFAKEIRVSRSEKRSCNQIDVPSRRKKSPRPHPAAATHTTRSRSASRCTLAAQLGSSIASSRPAPNAATRTRRRRRRPSRRRWTRSRTCSSPPRAPSSNS